MREYLVLFMDSPQLNVTKRIFIALPEGYHDSDEHYPVLYLHDGQNLFDDMTAHHKRSWRILDELEGSDAPKVILVGIENGGTKRADELIPWEFKFNTLNNKGGGKADLYLDFITETVKPYVDLRFRTFKNRKNTGIMGSSFGGVNSFYAALKYNHVFSRFGCLSNAFFYGFYDKMKDLASASDFHGVRRLYMDFGTNESSVDMENDDYLRTNKEMYAIVQSKLDDSHLRFEVIDGGKHHERDWQKRFVDILTYLFE